VCFVIVGLDKKEALVGLMGFSVGSASRLHMPCFFFFFHLTAMHHASFRERRSGNVVPGALGTRSSYVGNIRNEYIHVPRWFHKMMYRVPRSRSSFPMFREHGDA
jgi:hypothetical protein